MSETSNNNSSSADSSEAAPAKKTAPGFLSESNGKPSSMRLMCFIALLASIWFGYLAITLADGKNENGLYITTAFLLAAFAPKALQKFLENYYPK
ncbi:MAG: hypothetical protein SD837_10370 [Candidatus Electrothrix scaldis]|nr:MAG: hypothetical protein SD837_10370 [Candidatus Electrothrix sp. GW3-3]